MIGLTPESVEFRGAGVSVWISASAVSAMLAASVQAGCRETGGILIGRYGAEGWMADVIEATPKPKGSRASWFWFQRSNTGLAEILEQRWKDGFHYLGEWHFHPRGASTPSGSDERAMWKISADEAYRCPTPILVILGGKPKSEWSLSATLFRGGQVLRLDRHKKDEGGLRLVGQDGTRIR